MAVLRMKSWRDHPAISGQQPAPAPVVVQFMPQLSQSGRYAVQTFAGRFVVIDHTGTPVSTIRATRRDAEELAEKLNLSAEREERFGQARRRDCLSCTREFMSEGIHNRLCPYCSQLGHSPSRW